MLDRLQIAPSGVPNIFKKKVRNRGLFCAPREVEIHQLVASAQDPSDRITARLLDYRRGPFSTTLKIEYLPEAPPKRLRDLGDVAGFISNLERRTSRMLSRRAEPVGDHLDFYRSGACNRGRYDLASIAAAYRQDHDAPIAGFDDMIECMVEAFKQDDTWLAVAEPVVSHLDQLLQNFARVSGRLHLIDWGEGYVGRFGFDAGCFLMVMLRSYKLPLFEAEAARFLQSYRKHMAEIAPENLTAAMRRIFVPRMLAYLLRADAIHRYETRDGLDAWRDKIAYVGKFASPTPWRELGFLRD